jgi:N-acetylglutamate synthase-like GNAT family acetyltransferase
MSTIRKAESRDVAAIQVLMGHLVGDDVNREAIEDRLRPST